MPRVDPKDRGPTLPMFKPESDWRPPTAPPNLAGVKRLGIDTETKDPGLLTFGPGVLHGKAHSVGVSLSTGDASWYFPTHHPSDNCDWDVYAWLADLCKEERDWVGANLPYDVEILEHRKVYIKGRWLDVQIAEPLLDEERDGGYKLDVLAKYYLGEEKNEDKLKEAAGAYGVDPKGGLWQLPARFVGPYAEDDARLSLQVFDKQRPLLTEDGLDAVFDMETELLPIVYEMRKRGVRINLERAEELRALWIQREADLRAELRTRLGGVEVEVGKPKHLIQLCETKGITYPLTDKKNPSFTNDWLEAHPCKELNLVAQIRKVVHMRSGFLDGSVLKYQINGRLHASFHTMRGDEDGTRTGRFSSSQPNLQQIPARDPYYGPEMRSLFLPEEDGLWFSGDFKAQEPRLLVHVANRMVMKDGGPLPGVAEIIAEYHADPLLDSHMRTATLCSTDKPKAKTVGLGVTYGMGVVKLAEELGLDLPEAEALLELYNDKVPYTRHAAAIAKRLAKNRGYVRTLLGRRRHFKLVGLRRLYPHKGLNSIIQGSGADMIKRAIIEVYRQLKQVPLITVHDENNYNVVDRAMALLITEIMENALPIDVPNKIDTGLGKNWSEAH